MYRAPGQLRVWIYGVICFEVSFEGGRGHLDCSLYCVSAKTGLRLAGEKCWCRVRWTWLLREL